GFRIAGVPVITVAGVVTGAFLLFNIVKWITDTTYGINNSTSFIYLAFLYVLAIVVYVVALLYRRRQGIDLRAIHAEIPVEQFTGRGWRHRPPASSRTGGLAPLVIDSTLRAYQSPTRMAHGLGSLSALGEEARGIGITRPLVVTDAGIVSAGLLDEAAGRLRASDLEPVVYAEVRANPGVELVDAGARLYRSEGCDGLIAIGGGSSMDTAKGIGVVAAHGGSIGQYEWGRDPIHSRVPPLVAVPTTAGTGSEVTLWAVITDPLRKVKFNVGGTPNIAAWVALVDPSLTLDLPPTVTARTGMDALARAWESFPRPSHQPFTDAVALLAMEYCGRWWRVAFAQSHNVEARYHMSMAAMLAGLAYGTDSAGAAHAMSQTAGGVHDVP